MEIHANGTVVRMDKDKFDMTVENADILLRVTKENDFEIELGDQLFIIATYTAVTLSEGKVMIEAEEKYVDAY